MQISKYFLQNLTSTQNFCQVNTLSQLALRNAEQAQRHTYSAFSQLSIQFKDRFLEPDSKILHFLANKSSRDKNVLLNTMTKNSPQVTR